MKFITKKGFWRSTLLAASLLGKCSHRMDTKFSAVRYGL